MHRKSMEAAQTLSQDIIKQQRGLEDDEESRSSSDEEEPERKPKIDEKDDFRSNSIAALRAKAQEHSAKMFGTFDRDQLGGKMFGLHPGSGSISGGDPLHGHYGAPAHSGPDTQQSVF